MIYIVETESYGCDGRSPRWAAMMSPHVAAADAHPERSPHTGRTFVEKTSFLNNIELEPDVSSRTGQVITYIDSAQKRKKKVKTVPLCDLSIRRK